MEAFFRKNESETNEIVSKLLLAIYAFILLIGLCCLGGIFDISRSMMNAAVAISAVPLLLPVILIYVAHSNKPYTKYLLITMLGLLSGAYYCIFTFQALLIFVIPSILAVFYLDKRLFYYSGCLTIAVIMISHAVTGIYLFQPWIEPFHGMKHILQYGALPRCMQYLLIFGLLAALNKRFLDYIEKMTQSALDGKNEIHDQSEMSDQKKIQDQNEKSGQKKIPDQNRKELEQLLALFTDREKDVFLLMINGKTNMQIAETLCLSMGTVKNYVSAIYDKAGSRERNWFILKYSRYYADYDQSNTKL